LFSYFRNAFLVPRGVRWFHVGIIIESTVPSIGDRAFAKLRNVLPHVRFDLLSKTDRRNALFQNVFRVKHPLGGLRLLFCKRKYYDLVVFFAAGKGQLRLCRAFALLLMRPTLFYVVNEFGDGFWLNRENWSQIRKHLDMRYAWQKRWNAVARWLRALQRALVWLAWLPIRILQVLYAGLLFLAALLLLAVLRTTYDTYYYRFRFFSKTAAAPRRQSGDLEAKPALAAAASEQTAHEVLPPR
jgi:hypothetical protein